MRETHEYLMPDYYPHFLCKMGACRAACCENWPVSLSMEDYFRLVGLSCRRGLRQKLDCALHMKSRPTPESYAEIAHRFDGSCPVRMDDGRCALQAELGEEHLPYICRLYPRAIRSEGDYECSCAASCERVIELLLDHPEPIAFIRREATVDVPENHEPTIFYESVAQEQRLRLALIECLQTRGRPLEERILRLHAVMARIDAAIAAGTASELDLSAVEADIAAAHCGPERALAAVETLLEAFGQRRGSLTSYIEAIAAYLGRDKKTAERYLRARKEFEARFPFWESAFENLLVNHMFFSRFPFSDQCESMADEFAAMCAGYALLRVLSIGWTALHPEKEALVDLLAAAFRRIDHTPFHQYSAALLHRADFCRPEQLAELAHL